MDSGILLGIVILEIIGMTPGVVGKAQTSSVSGFFDA
jgi:uncharacterized membrane protein (DUF441 family)